MGGKFRWAMVAGIALVVHGQPAWAQDTSGSAKPVPSPTVSASKPASATQTPSDETSITIFARRPTSGSSSILGVPFDQRSITVDRRGGSDCGFAADPSIRKVPGYKLSNIRSPYGDASTGPTDRLPFSAPAPGGSSCGESDWAFSAGRAEIARHDRSLQDAFAAYDAQDYPRALELFKYSYNKMGYNTAATIIGKMYLLGIGSPRDTAEAIVWLKKAAEAPWTPPSIPTPPKDFEARTPAQDAAMILAQIYESGWDVPKDLDEARHWYARADDLDYYPATQIMGMIYLRGIYGVNRSPTTAIIHLKRAGQMGYAPSQYTLGEIYYFGDDGVPQNKTLAGSWLLLAARHNYPDALYAVARMYELGEGGAAVDPAKALDYYKEAAVRGQPDAQNVIGTDFYLGTGLPRDLGFARKWFLRSAENGNPDAMFNLGVMMVNGEGGPKDLIRAYCWFSVAKKGGNGNAGAALQELSGKMTADERAQAEALLNPAKS